MPSALPQPSLETEVPLDALSAEDESTGAVELLSELDELDESGISLDEEEELSIASCLLMVLKSISEE